MKIFLLLSICFFYNLQLYSQNFVNDPGFDDKFNCPSYQVFRPQQSLVYWKGSNGTSYMNKCNTNANEPYWLTNKVPQNSDGYQEALSDSGYILFSVFINLVNDNRGIIFQKLKNALELNKKYWIEYYVSLGDSSNYAVKKLGVSFQVDTNFNTTDGGYSRPFKLENNNEVISEKIRWTNLHWIFSPDSNYTSIIIGYSKNISNLNDIDTVSVGPPCYWCNQYGFLNICRYFLENVGVFPIISNNQTLQPCTFPQVLQGPLGNDIWFREWKKDTTVLGANINQTINQPGTYTLTWRTDTTVHIDTFWVEAALPIANFLGQDMAWQSGSTITLAAPTGYSYLWNTGSTAQNIMVDTTGIFAVVLTNTFNCSYTDSVLVYNPLAVKEIFDERELEISPNPSSEFIMLSGKISNLIFDDSNLEILNIDGRVISNIQLPKNRIIDVSRFSNGIYFVRVFNRHVNGFLIAKFIVNK